MDHHKAVEEYLTASGHKFEVDQFKSQAVYRYSVANEETMGKAIDVEIFIKPYSGYFNLFAYSPRSIAEDRRAEFLELFAENNFNNEPFKTELNPSTGRVRCGFASILMDECLASDQLTKMEKTSVTLISNLDPLLQTARDDG